MARRTGSSRWVNVDEATRKGAKKIMKLVFLLHRIHVLNKDFGFRSIHELGIYIGPTEGYISLSEYRNTVKRLL